MGDKLKLNEDVSSQGILRRLRTPQHQHVDGAGFVKPRAPVTAHNHTAGVGHGNGRPPRDCPGDCSKANEAFNSNTSITKRYTHKPGQIVGAGVKLN